MVSKQRLCITGNGRRKFVIEAGEQVFTVGLRTQHALNLYRHTHVAINNAVVALIAAHIIHGAGLTEQRTVIIETQVIVIRHRTITVSGKHGIHHGLVRQISGRRDKGTCADI